METKFDSLLDSVVDAHKSGKQDDMRKAEIELMSNLASDKELRDWSKTFHSNLEYNSQYFAHPTGSKHIAIVAYATPSVPAWDPDSIANGLAGSEEAVVYVSQELVKRGFRVTVYANPPDKSIWSLKGMNPRYVNISQYVKDSEEIHIGILWRRTDFSSAKNKCDRVYFWPHDSPTNTQIDITGLDGIFYLSKHHRSQFLAIQPSLSKIPSVIAGNGIILTQFSKPNRSVNPYSCIYSSNYSRGLRMLLDIWPDVHKAYPNATLDIYYGREVWGTMTTAELNKLVADIEILKTKGVMEKGKVGHEELAKAMCTSSILAYPCNTETETYCITVVKAQAAGCIPVTTRIGALAETVHPEARTLLKAEKEAYKTLLLDTMKYIKETKDSVIDEERKKYIDFASGMTWSAVVDKWFELIGK